jgi:hypothetical protein
MPDCPCVRREAFVCVREGDLEPSSTFQWFLLLGKRHLLPAVSL